MALQNDYNLQIIILALVMVILAAIILGYVVYCRRVKKYKTDISLLKIRIEEQKHRINDIREQERRIAKIRHDFKNHIITGLSLLQDGKILQAQKYLAKYIHHELSAIKVYVDTSNEFINAVVNEKFRLCSEKGITAEAEISFGSQKVDDIDLCSVLFNLLDNAIEACEKIDGERRIKLMIFNHQAYLVIRVVNTSGGKVLENNPELETTKADKAHHGIGTRTVKNIAKKYSGIFRVEEYDGKFSAEVWMKNI